MSASPFDHPLLSGLLGDAELASFFTADAELSEMLAFEGALLSAEEAEGLIPTGTSAAALPALAAFKPDLTKLRDATARDGVIVVEFVRQLRERLPAAAAPHIHFGATSQDVVDTSLIRRLRPILSILEARIHATIESLDALDRRFGSNPVMGRTRMQDALPIAVGDRLAAWRGPLIRDIDRLTELRPRLLVLQFGGAVGTLDKLGDKAPAIARRLAAALDLALPPRSWHSQRDSIAELANWLALVTGTLGKIGTDIGVMAQTAIGEIVIEGGGSSSAMPHKSNPVAAEVLVALAHANAAHLSGMNTAVLHEQERSGVAWTLEWLLLPQMLMATGASLRTALALLSQITRLGHPA